MRGELRITKRNWKHFESSLDALTKEPYKIGDRVIKCSACKLTFHAEYLEGEKCPSCRQPFVPAVIETGVIRLGYDRKIVRPNVKKVRTVPKWWKQADFSGIAARWLTRLGVLGVALSAGLLVWAVMQPGVGWEGFCSWMSGTVFPGAAFRLEQAAGNLAELLGGMKAAANLAAEQLKSAVGALEQVAETMGGTIEELIYQLDRL